MSSPIPTTDIKTDTEVIEEKKKPRKRMKIVRQTIKKQMEFYFSDSNLNKDRFIKKEIEKSKEESKEGYLDLAIFLNFNKISQLTQDTKVLSQALKKSDMLQVSEDGTMVRRTTPVAIPNPKDTDSRTVYIECLPRHSTHEWVKEVFSQCGDVMYVSLPRFHTTGDIKGFGFVEFASKEAAAKACEKLNNPPPESVSRVGKFPKSNKTLSQLQRQVGAPDVEEDAQTENVKESIVSSKENINTDDAIQKPCKKHRKRRRCASESSVDLLQDKPQSTKKLKLNPQDDKSDSLKTEKAETTSEVEHVDAEDKKEAKRLKRKRQRLSDNIVLNSGNLDVSEKDDVEKKKTKQEEVVSEEKKTDKKKAKLSDAGSENEPTPKKKVKLVEAGSENEKENKKISKMDADVGSADSKEASKSGAEDKSEKKEKSKKIKRKRRKKSMEKDVPLPQLRVIPKEDWLNLKKDYLSHQKKSMTNLKKQLKTIKAADNNINETNNAKENCKKGNEITFVPDVIVRTASDSAMNKKDLRVEFGTDVQVAYFDFQDGATNGYIRCENGQSAKTLLNMAKSKYTFSLLSGDEEKAYWDKATSDRKAKLNKDNKNNKNKKRGTQKLTEKAYSHNTKVMKNSHVVFD